MSRRFLADSEALMRSSIITSDERVGDLMIGFSADVPTIARADSSSWAVISETPEWRLWQHSVGPTWKGSPVRHLQSPGWEVWLLGELYGENGVGETWQSRLLQVVHGEVEASQLNGHFLLWAWSEAQQQWHVWTDPCGTLHAYYACDGPHAALGTCLRTVAQLASRRQLDWLGLTGFFGLGFFPQDRTFYEDVRILRPATRYRFGRDGVLQEATRYRHWRHQPAQRNYEDTVLQFSTLFDQVMQEQLAYGRIALPISGGLDSRTTVAAINPNNPELLPRVWAYSYGYTPGSVETAIARQLANARALGFTGFTIRPYLFDRLDLVLASVEGFQDVTQSRQAFVASDLAMHADSVIAAHWGDVWFDGMGLHDSGNPHPSESEVVAHTIKKMAKRGHAWLWDNLCAPHLHKDKPAELTRGLVQEELAALGHIEDPDFRVKVFKTEAWSFRWTTASLRMFQAAAFPRLPFYDQRLVDFFCTVPSAFVQDRRMQIDYLKRFAPDLARVKWQVADTNLYRYQRWGALRFAKRAVKKMWRMATGAKVLQRNWEVQFTGPSGEAGLQQWLLRSGLRLHEYVPREKVQALVDAFRVAPVEEGRGYTISMLVTFSAWLERNG